MSIRQEDRQTGRHSNKAKEEKERKNKGKGRMRREREREMNETVCQKAKYLMLLYSDSLGAQ